MDWSLALNIQINGKQRSFPEFTEPVELTQLIETLELKDDRIAVEHNGEIVPRTAWSGIKVQAGDKLEIVHFVGGGLA
jgi:thiamine biosynthesis protein ThiS